VFHVILYEPEIPPNTGNVIRLCANTGARLHLVQPLGFRLDNKSLLRSGLDYHDLADVSVHADLIACVAALKGSRIFAVETGAARRYSDLRYRASDAFLFGPETRGLPKTLLDELGLDSCVRVPMREANRSLNLSNTVSLVIYEAWRQLDFATDQRASQD
jgi:tRNA (cytidine/uridine-2'-O-)-methyltransferase